MPQHVSVVVVGAGLAGLTTATPLKKVYDLNAAVGGPLKRDRVWFFATARTQGSTRANVNQFYNLNAGDPTKWLYAPDLNQRAYNDRTSENISGRITWQISARTTAAFSPTPPAKQIASPPPSAAR